MKKSDYKIIGVAVAISAVVTAVIVYASNNVDAVEDVIG